METFKRIIPVDKFDEELIKIKSSGYSVVYPLEYAQHKSVIPGNGYDNYGSGGREVWNADMSKYNVTIIKN